MRALASLLGALLALCASSWLFAQDSVPQAPQWTAGQPGESLQIALVTVGPGDIYWQRFGHNAILVSDRDAGTEVLYNYGIFDFAEPGFLFKFLRGDMYYSMAARRPADDLAQYEYEQRRVTAQVLNLSPPQRLALAEFLEWNARPENARYRYDYFRTNCSTKVRDALDAALGGAIKAASDGRSRGYTQRMHAQRLTAPDLLVYLGVHAGLGPSTDQPIDFWDEMFVPMELERRLREVRVRDDAGNQLPLVASEFEIHRGRIAEPADPPAWTLRFLATGLLLAALLYWLGSAEGLRRRGFGVVAGALWLVAGLGGITLLGLWFATTHDAAWRNHNLALFHPLCLLLLPAAWRALRGRAPQARTSAWIAAVILASAACAWLLLVLPGYRQQMIDWIALWLPIHASAWWVLQRRA